MHFVGSDHARVVKHADQLAAREAAVQLQGAADTLVAHAVCCGVSTHAIHTTQRHAVVTIERATRGLGLQTANPLPIAFAVQVALHAGRHVDLAVAPGFYVGRLRSTQAGVFTSRQRDRQLGRFAGHTFVVHRPNQAQLAVFDTACLGIVQCQAANGLSPAQLGHGLEDITLVAAPHLSQAQAHLLRYRLGGGVAAQNGVAV